MFRRNHSLLLMNDLGKPLNIVFVIWSIDFFFESKSSFSNLMDINEKDIVF